MPTTAASRHQLDAASVERAWTERTGSVLVASPSNPTGTSVPPAELAAICELARARGAWRIVDEIYLDLSDPAPDGTAPRSVLARDPDAVVVNSFSKYFGMTGWRLGWAVLPEELVPAVEKLAMNYFLCASAPAQQAALACFTPESLALCEERRVELVARRRLALDGLARIGLPVAVEPDGAFYAYFDVSGTGLGSWEFCERALQEAHVALTPGSRLRHRHRRDPRAVVLRRLPRGGPGGPAAPGGVPGGSTDGPPGERRAPASPGGTLRWAAPGGGTARDGQPTGLAAPGPAAARGGLPLGQELGAPGGPARVRGRGPHRERLSRRSPASRRPLTTSSARSSRARSSA